ncbi:MAG: CxxH/CxxC protein [Candidatus Kuenenia stuttgartiensis]|jgi:CxxH/CxxC protein (TIGR04129 family)|uniref:CxxH/CxxC protein n=1 Tax=Candidatus Kuenenia TaxID=380738 RepID=UPI00030161F9|nr:MULTISPECIES: CxxH/CxxC protein [Kuenenia]MBZ0193247.1 CxxH/CxxC protein [Candidatus Kuenenia stuttgartiensis]MCL4728000.1 CxxH/CxxC protein [Candidatus Kuenenia stuttgartiensis]MCZ7622095.1 CxxH/CxxC protein [Candidatus Kuenenia sp.]
MKIRGVKGMYVVCEEHIEIAIDEFVNVYEVPPDIYILDKGFFSDWTSPNHYDMCDNPPKYLVV